MIAIGADHGGFELKEEIKKYLDANGIEYKDFGTYSPESVDYAALAGETITVAASPAPHAEILAIAKDILKAKGVELKVIEYTDYVQPNNVVDSGEVDANYFQHKPYLDDFNAENGTKVICVSYVHVEPMGLYGGKQTTLDAVK